MKKVLFQSEVNGEKMEIWQTEQTELAAVWAEIDQDYKPEIGGYIYFDGDNNNFLVVNGGV